MIFQDFYILSRLYYYYGHFDNLENYLAFETNHQRETQQQRVQDGQRSVKEDLQNFLIYSNMGFANARYDIL